MQSSSSKNYASLSTADLALCKNSHGGPWLGRQIKSMVTPALCDGAVQTFVVPWRLWCESPWTREETGCGCSMPRWLTNKFETKWQRSFLRMFHCLMRALRPEEFPQARGASPGKGRVLSHFQSLCSSPPKLVDPKVGHHLALVSTTLTHDDLALICCRPSFFRLWAWVWWVSCFVFCVQGGSGTWGSDLFFML